MSTVHTVTTRRLRHPTATNHQSSVGAGSSFITAAAMSLCFGPITSRGPKVVTDCSMTGSVAGEKQARVRRQLNTSTDATKGFQVRTQLLLKWAFQCRTSIRLSDGHVNQQLYRMLRGCFKPSDFHSHLTPLGGDLPS